MKPFEPMTYDELSERLKAEFPPEVNPALKMAAAKGSLPLITSDLVSYLYYLANDNETSVKRAARRSLRSLPTTIIHTALTGRISPKILHWFAHLDLQDPKFYEHIALNKETLDETFIYLAGNVEHIAALEIIARNQIRLLNSPEIIEALENNSATPISTLQSVIDFYRLQVGRSHTDVLAEMRGEDAISNDDEIPADEAPLKDSPGEEIESDVANSLEQATDPDISPQDVDLNEITAEQEATLSPVGEIITSDEESLLEQGILEKFSIEDLVNEKFQKDSFFAKEFLIDTVHQLNDETRESLANRIRKMKVINQMRLALKGNLESRNILIKSGNKLVQECVLRNPRITIEEVLKLSKDKSAREELIRAVSINREWTKSYSVMHTLCWNPKTPIQQTSKFLNRLTVKDLQSISRSKQVPGMLAVQARKLIEQKERFNASAGS